MRLAAGVTNVLSLGLAILGLTLGRKQRFSIPALKYFWMLFLVFYLFHAAIFPVVRYLVPTLPAMAVLGGIGLQSLYSIINLCRAPSQLKEEQKS